MTKERLEKEAEELIQRFEMANSMNCFMQLTPDRKQIGEMLVMITEPREKRIADLERKLEQTEKDLTDYQFNYPKIKELEKENARLKEDLKICEGNADNYYTRLMELQEQTIKATGIGLSCDNCNWNQFDEDEMCYCCSNKDKWELKLRR